MSRSRVITKMHSRRAHEQKQSIPCNRYRCPFPLSDFSLTKWSNWLPGCVHGRQTFQKVWRQRTVNIPKDAYHEDGNIEIVSRLSKKYMKLMWECVKLKISFSISLTQIRLSKEDSAQSAVIPVSGSAVQNAAVMMSRRILNATDSSTSQKDEA